MADTLLLLIGKQNPFTSTLSCKMQSKILFIKRDLTPITLEFQNVICKKLMDSLFEDINPNFFYFASSLPTSTFVLICLSNFFFIYVVFIICHHCVYDLMMILEILFIFQSSLVEYRTILGVIFLGIGTGWLATVLVQSLGRKIGMQLGTFIT